jgi:hypothetical protein
VQPIGNGTVMIGMRERTTPLAVLWIARSLFRPTRRSRCPGTVRIRGMCLVLNRAAEAGRSSGAWSRYRRARPPNPRDSTLDPRHRQCLQGHPQTSNFP